MIKNVKNNDVKIFDVENLDKALRLLSDQLELRRCPKTELVVCGGSALIAASLVLRTTRDVDVVALMESGQLVSADPLPEHLLVAVERVAQMMHLPTDWLNNGPASQFIMGLPPGFSTRLQCRTIGTKLTIYYIGRIDQIYFKVFASADRGGYHIDDLKALCPSEEELLDAAKWCMEQDVSEGFRFIIKEMLTQCGWKNVSIQI